MTHSLLAGRMAGRTLGTMRPLLLIAALAGLYAADDYDEPGRAGWGAFAVPPSLAVQAAKDLVPGQGLMVVAVRPGGTADVLGVDPGDVILELNGQPVSTRRELRAIVRQAEAGDAVRVTLSGSSGQTTLRGAFQERQPRPAGPPPWLAFAGMEAMAGGPPPGIDGSWPPPSAAEQREQLLAEQAAMASAAAELAAVPRPAPTPAWFIAVEIR